MDGRLLELADERCVIIDGDGPIVRDAKDAPRLVEEALSHRATTIVVDVSRLDPVFFQLRSGLAGEVLGKAASYKLKFAIVGDVSGYVAASDALRDFVVECNRGRGIWFVPDIDALRERLAAVASARAGGQ